MVVVLYTIYIYYTPTLLFWFSFVSAELLVILIISNYMPTINVIGVNYLCTTFKFTSNYEQCY